MGKSLQRDVSPSSSATWSSLTSVAGGQWIRLTSPDCLAEWGVIEKHDKAIHETRRRTGPASSAYVWVDFGAVVVFRAVDEPAQHVDPLTGIQSAAGATVPKVRVEIGAAPQRDQLALYWSSAAGNAADAVELVAFTAVALWPVGTCRRLEVAADVTVNLDIGPPWADVRSIAPALLHSAIELGAWDRASVLNNTAGACDLRAAWTEVAHG